MKLRYVLILSLLSFVGSSYAMQPTSGQPASNKSCMSKTCAFGGCCFAALDTILEVGEHTLEILEAANPNLIEKSIFDVVIKLIDLSQPSLLALAKACKDEEAKIDAADAKVLKSVGLMSCDGQISQQVKDVVNNTIKVTKSI